MKKRSRRLLAIVCSIALVIGSFATYVGVKDVKATDYSTLYYTNATTSSQNVKYAIAFVERDADHGSNFNVVETQSGDSVLYVALKDIYTKPNFKSISCNGHTDSNPTTGCHMFIQTSWFNYNAYNVVTMVDALDNDWTFVVRAGDIRAVAPTSATASAQAGVPGSINVSWTEGSNVPDGQVYRIYIDGEMKKGGISGTSAVVNNVDGGTHTVQVKGFYNENESDPATTEVTVDTGVRYSSAISIEGFQIRSNYDESGQAPSSVAFRTMCKAPKVGSTVKANGVNYTVASFGTIYGKDVDASRSGKAEDNTMDASYTLLDPTPVENQDWQYEGLRNRVRTKGYVATANAIISDYKSGDTDNTYYAFTMQGMDGNMANTLWVRPFVVTTNNTIIYGKTTAYTSVAEIANTLYVNSMCKNITSHNYLYSAILNSTQLQSDYNTYGNIYYRTSQVTYGWNGNLYIGFRLVPDSWNGTSADEGQYAVVGDWRIHASSHYNDGEGHDQAKASYRGNTNDELEVRVENPGEENWTDGQLWNWGIQMKLNNNIAYSRLEDGKDYTMVVSYNTTDAGTMRVKPEGNGNASGWDMVYDFDAVEGNNVHRIPIHYSRAKFILNPGADPSIVLVPAKFEIKSAAKRDELHIEYNGSKAEGSAGGFPAGTVISKISISFEEGIN